MHIVSFVGGLRTGLLVRAVVEVMVDLDLVLPFRRSAWVGVEVGWMRRIGRSSASGAEIDMPCSRIEVVVSTSRIGGFRRLIPCA